MENPEYHQATWLMLLLLLFLLLLVQQNMTTKITNHHDACNPRPWGRMDVGCEMLQHNYWKAINTSVGKCSSRAGLCWGWAPAP